MLRRIPTLSSLRATKDRESIHSSDGSSFSSQEHGEHSVRVQKLNMNMDHHSGHVCTENEVQQIEDIVRSLEQQAKFTLDVVRSALYLSKRFYEVNTTVIQEFERMKKSAVDFAVSQHKSNITCLKSIRKLCEMEILLAELVHAASKQKACERLVVKKSVKGGHLLHMPLIIAVTRYDCAYDSAHAYDKLFIKERKEKLLKEIQKKAAWSERHNVSEMNAGEDIAPDSEMGESMWAVATEALLYLDTHKFHFKTPKLETQFQEELSVRENTMVLVGYADQLPKAVDRAFDLFLELQKAFKTIKADVLEERADLTVIVNHYDGSSKMLLEELRASSIDNNKYLLETEPLHDTLVEHHAHHEDGLGFQDPLRCKAFSEAVLEFLSFIRDEISLQNRSSEGSREEIDLLNTTLPTAQKHLKRMITVLSPHAEGNREGRAVAITLPRRDLTSSNLTFLHDLLRSACKFRRIAFRKKYQGTSCYKSHGYSIKFGEKAAIRRFICSSQVLEDAEFLSKLEALPFLIEAAYFHFDSLLS